jgi:two-component system CheB/CheR fusion protein
MEFELLLEYLRDSRGFDFTGYKRASLTRRVTRRMEAVGCASYPEYQDYLEVHPDEFGLLFNTILINVTSFFRDEAAWQALEAAAIPRILAAKKDSEPVRLWSCGCATGEEPYTLAIAMAEAVGLEAFRDRVKIYATDMDDEALAKARHGCYTEREVGGIRPDLLEKYFENTDGRFCFRKDLRRNVIFGRHDIIQDAPISRIDLLTCRNLLMYFNAETQARILARFNFALEEHGILFLGHAEMLLTQSSLFNPVDLKWRFFAKAGRLSARNRLMLMGQGVAEAPAVNDARESRIRDAAFDASSAAQLVIDLAGTLLGANEQARTLFGLNAPDIGRPIQDLELSYRPIELRSMLERAREERTPQARKEVEWTGAASQRWFDVTVVPLIEVNGAVMGSSVTFVDVTRYQRLRQELEHANQELETAYEELQSTNEELETTNEELQSTIEELETTNEELQSTNEELETMNEELQSTNEELQTINDEMRIRSDEILHLNAYLNSILTSLRGGVVVVNEDLQIITWNRQMEEMWGLRSEEVLGKSFLNLDVGLAVDRLRQAIRNCIAGHEHSHVVVEEATNRRGKPFRCEVTVTPLLGGDGEPRGAIVMMQDASPTA